MDLIGRIRPALVFDSLVGESLELGLISCTSDYFWHKTHTLELVKCRLDMSIFEQPGYELSDERILKKVKLDNITWISEHAPNVRLPLPHTTVFSNNYLKDMTAHLDFSRVKKLVWEG